MRTLELTDPPQRGEDIRELQQLLGVNPDGVYGPATAAAVYRKKLALGYQTPDHSAGDLLIAYLTGKKKPTAAMVTRARQQKKVVPNPGSTTVRPATAKPTKKDDAAARESAVRAAAVLLMHFLLDQNPRVHYPLHDVRTMTIHELATRGDLDARMASNLTLDCSQSVTLIAHIAGAKDPNGGKYAADGFTGTLLKGCTPITRAQAQPGDLRVFGGGTGHHVCMVLAGGGDPLLFSHGQEPDPIAIRESVEARFQPSGGTFLRLPI